MQPMQPLHDSISGLGSLLLVAVHFRKCISSALNENEIANFNEDKESGNCSCGEPICEVQAQSVSHWSVIFSPFPFFCPESRQLM